MYGTRLHKPLTSPAAKLTFSTPSSACRANDSERPTAHTMLVSLPSSRMDREPLETERVRVPVTPVLSTVQDAEMNPEWSCATAPRGSLRNFKLKRNKYSDSDRLSVY